MPTQVIDVPQTFDELRDLLGGNTNGMPSAISKASDLYRQSGGYVYEVSTDDLCQAFCERFGRPIEQGLAFAAICADHGKPAAGGMLHVTSFDLTAVFARWTWGYWRANKKENVDAKYHHCHNSALAIIGWLDRHDVTLVCGDERTERIKTRTRETAGA